jgi:hypothetical protein
MALAEAYALRAYDAVQLAVAVELNARIVAQNTALGIPASVSPTMTVISSDSELNIAAAAERLIVDDPLSHP